MQQFSIMGDVFAVSVGMMIAAVATDLACVGAGQEAQREVAPDVQRRLLSCLLQQSWIPVSSSILLF